MHLNWVRLYIDTGPYKNGIILSGQVSYISIALFFRQLISSVLYKLWWLWFYNGVACILMEHERMTSETGVSLDKYDIRRLCWKSFAPLFMLFIFADGVIVNAFPCHAHVRHELGLGNTWFTTSYINLQLHLPDLNPQTTSYKQLGYG